MKPWCLAFLLAAVPARAGFDFEAAVSDLSRVAAAAAQKSKQRKIHPLEPVPALATDAALPAILDAPLAELRDASLSAVTVELGGRSWSVGAAPDAEYDDFYLVMTSAGERLLAALSPLGRFLEDAGVVVSDDEGPVLRLTARISLLHPISGTTVVAVDASGGRRSRDSFTVGELIEALKTKGRSFRAGEKELHLFVQPEVARGGASLTSVRTIFIARFSGLRSSAYALRESALSSGAAVRVRAYGRILVLHKTPNGRLIVRDAGPQPRAR